MPDILLHLLPALIAGLIYAALGVHFWQTRWRSAEATPTSRQTLPWERGAILAGLALHGSGLYLLIFADGGMRFSFSAALSLMLWLAVLIYWLEGFRSPMDGLQPLVLPIAALCAMLPIAFPQTHRIANADAIAFQLHFLAAMLAYSLFTLSALHAIFMGIAERRLHNKSVAKQFSGLPPLLAMETLLFRMITAGFVLLTVALISGVAFSETLFGKVISVDHKTVFAFASWGVFAALLVGRRMYGWRGRIALRWTLTGFLFLLLAYVGSRFVSEVLLGRI